MLEKFAVLLRDQADEIESMRAHGSDGGGAAGCRGAVRREHGRPAMVADGGRGAGSIDLAPRRPTVVSDSDGRWDAAAFRGALDQRREDVRRQAGPAVGPTK